MDFLNGYSLDDVSSLAKQETEMNQKIRQGINDRLYEQKRDLQKKIANIVNEIQNSNVDELIKAANILGINDKEHPHLAYQPENKNTGLRAVPGFETIWRSTSYKSRFAVSIQPDIQKPDLLKLTVDQNKNISICFGIRRNEKTVYYNEENLMAIAQPNNRTVAKSSFNEVVTKEEVKDIENILLLAEKAKSGLEEINMALTKHIEAIKEHVTTFNTREDKGNILIDELESRLHPQPFLEEKLEQLIESCKDADPEYFKGENISDPLESMIQKVFSKKELAEQYDWDSSNIMAHFEYERGSLPKIVVNKWFYDPDTGRKETGQVDEIIIREEKMKTLKDICYRNNFKALAQNMTKTVKENTENAASKLSPQETEKEQNAKRDENEK